MELNNLIEDYIRFEDVDIINENKDVLLADLSFSVKSGETLLITGKSGSGKTAIYKAIHGFLKLSKGEISFSDKISRLQIGYMPQMKTALRNVPFTAWEVAISSAAGTRRISKAYTAKEKAYLREKLDRLGIEEYKIWRYKRLPGPEQQMFLLARALNVGTRLLVLEDPCSLMETEEDFQLIKDVLKECKKQGVAMIITAENPQTYLSVCDKVLYIENKKTVFYGLTDEYVSSEVSR